MKDFVGCRVEVNNLPVNTSMRGYMVVRLVKGEFWYYGLYTDKSKAEQAVKETGNGGIIEV